ncbi:MAG TPA: GNAT family N-acetyltransferase [Rhizomicrobium sp.]
MTRAGVFNPEEILVAQSLATEALARGADAGYFFLFADGVEGLDGYTCYGPIPGNAGRFELYWIAVEPRSKRQGLAGRLLAASEQSVRSRSGSHMFAETSSRADYAAAHALYAAQGYKLHATVPDYHAAGDDLLIFGKIL